MTIEHAETTDAPLGIYRDVLFRSDGTVAWDGGWSHNVIVTDCRRLLAGFMHGGTTTTLGIQGLQVGQGQDVWDQPPGPPVPAATQTALVDPNPFTVAAASLQIDYLAGGNVVATPTNRVQIVATLGPGVPPWPDANHTFGTLREFGLVGGLDGTPVLIDYVTHPPIPKDPVSTLQRTIWLVF